MVARGGRGTRDKTGLAVGGSDWCCVAVVGLDRRGLPVRVLRESVACFGLARGGRILWQWCLLGPPLLVLPLDVFVGEKHVFFDVKSHKSE